MIRRKLSALLCGFFLLVTLSACSTTNQPAPDGGDDPSATTAAPLELTAQRDEFTLPIPGDELPTGASLQMSVATPMIELPLPEGENQARAEAFNDFMAGCTDAFVSEYKLLLEDAVPGAQIIIEINPVIARNDGKYLSVFFQGYLNTADSAYPTNLVASQSFRVSETAIEPLPLDALFSIPEAQSLALVQEKLITQAADFDQSALLAQFNPTQFYLTDESLVIYYPEGSLGPHALGIPSFSIPLAELSEFLA